MECLQGTPVPHYLNRYFFHVDLKDKIDLGDSTSIITKNIKKRHYNWKKNLKTCHTVQQDSKNTRLALTLHLGASV